jgi:hypothetical protein
MPLKVFRWISLVTLVWFSGGSTTFRVQLAAGQAEPGVAKKDAEALLTRAKEVMRFAQAGGSVIHYRAVAAAEQNYQSDRTYPPFFSAMEINEVWFDPQTGVDRVSTQTTFPGGGPYPPQVALRDATRAFRQTEKNLNPLPAASMQSRYLNPWAVIRDWAAAGDARVVSRAPYRDYVRIVLARATPGGEQRLFLDPKTGFPVKLDLEEKH